MTYSAITTANQSTLEHPLVRRLHRAFGASQYRGNNTNVRDYFPALIRFLKSTGSVQDGRRIFEAMPHLDCVDNIPALQSVLYRLQFKTTVEPCTEYRLRSEYLPCFLQTQDNELKVIEKIDRQGMVSCFCPRSKAVEQISKYDLCGTLIFPEKIEANSTASNTKSQWSKRTFRAFWPVIQKTFILSFAINLLAMCAPLFVMTVYDKAIGAGTVDVLAGLFVGIAMIISAEFLLRLVRSRIQAYLGARLDNQINVNAFQQIIHLPLQFILDAPLGSQLTRLKQITSVRDAFTGMLANAVFDLPFLVLFLTAIALVGGPVVIAPFSLIVLYIITAAWTIPLTKARIRKSGEKRTLLANLVVEAVSAKRAIQELNAEEIWLQRHRKLSAESAMANLSTRQLNIFVQTISQALLTVAGVLTLAIGVNMVLAETLSAGALIAVMALTWRVLNPIRNLLLSSLTLSQTMQSLEQIDRLHQLPVEREPNANPSISRSFHGKITFDRVSFRYPSQKEPALRAVSFSIEPGTMLCICGGSGSGKATVLRTLLGLFQQQAGSIFVDGLDLRQLDHGEWRQSLGVALDDSDFFYGTIAQNLRLAHPTATDKDIEEIAEKFGLDQYYGATLDRGIDTKLSASTLATWPDALKKRLSLCRAFIRNAPIHLLHNPAGSLDAGGEKSLLAMLQERKGNSTIIMTTHRPSHMWLADQVMWMEQGSVKAIGKPNAIVPHFFAD